ncbi:hypothetical protein ACUHMQ_20230 [Chitinimonas sp. PSY-7]|uniref:hypothetical protein n=1 Tax=Chitinimonas sp. PSY-7 TaxID=3459088 RepID=UPI00403FE273
MGVSLASLKSFKSDQKLRLQVFFSAVDKIAAPLKRVSTADTATTAKIKELRDKLSQLNKTTSQVDSYQTASEQLAKTGRTLKEGICTSLRFAAEGPCDIEQHRGIKMPRTKDDSRYSRSHNHLLAVPPSTVTLQVSIATVPFSTICICSQGISR